jgi:hypothetical protein
MVSNKYNPTETFTSEMPSQKEPGLSEGHITLHDRITRFKKQAEKNQRGWQDYCERAEDFIKGNHYSFDQEETELVQEYLT